MADVEEKVEDAPEVKPESVPYDEFEKIKRMQAGSDKAYAEAKKELDDTRKRLAELEKASMSDKERAEHELTERSKLLEAKEREVKDATLRLSKLKLMSDKGIAADMEKFVIGETEEEMQESIDTLAGLLEKQASERVKDRLKAGGVPKAGSPPKADFNSQIRSAFNARRKR